ncbi:alcohol dehydrogenase catalytic domain-containing protein [Anaerofustis stercorihominis]|uniref:GroES-like protein n=1 Tax=Anaerofustis stercorihominis DSM 17244 TaxID=445971 RepID=B1CBM4_9FIRM|nr:alcohol dehydrogenase catalytic domain-containing protein [Anaerofustis stercorihominis]EDS71671.1 GroES-like protein [Anaerofustis stercorihominis DSM 17244]MCQ4796271.1 alcohol dehydrogenase catalytic domain-containing protein [Anaerofustis stercorihominis]
MENQMKGICLNEDRTLQLKNFPVSPPTQGFVRVKIKRSGICASDLGYIKYGAKRLELPVILGHEGCGIIDEIGQGVKGFEKGERVVVMTTYELCGKCRYCKMGATNLCIKRKGIGSKVNGMFADYVTAPSSSLIKMRDHVTYEEACMTELTVCAVHGIVETAKVRANDWCLISGPGPVGLITALVAKAYGARVILAGLSADEKRLKKAKELGIDITVDISKENLEDIVYSKTEGYGVDISVECSGNYKSMKTCIELTAGRGKFLQMGIMHEIGSIDMWLVLHKELKIYSSLSQVPQSWKTAADLIAEKKVDVKALISKTYGLNDYKEAFEAAASGQNLKILFDPEI